MIDGHIKDITSLSNIEFDTETVYASSIIVNDYKLLLQVRYTGFLVMDIGSKEVLLNCTPNIGTEDRIEIATCWQIEDAIYVALCIVRDDSFSLEIVNIISNSSR